MTLLSGIVAVMNRLLGDVATATVGWAIALLYGRAPKAKQSTLSLVALGSLVWIIAVLAVVLPTLGGMLISSVPRARLRPDRLAAPGAGHRRARAAADHRAVDADRLRAGRETQPGGLARGDGPWLPAHGGPRRRHPLPRGRPA